MFSSSRFPYFEKKNLDFNISKNQNHSCLCTLRNSLSYYSSRHTTIDYSACLLATVVDIVVGLFISSIIILHSNMRPLSKIILAFLLLLLAAPRPLLAKSCWHKQSLLSSATTTTTKGKPWGIVGYRGGANVENSSAVFSNTTAATITEEITSRASSPSTYSSLTDTDSIASSSTSPDRYVFSVYQPGDGHEDDPDGLPRKFLAMTHGDREAAKAAFDGTKEWRKNHNVDTILQRPHPNFDICRIITPHSFLGHDKSGHVVFFQRPAVDHHQHLHLAKKNHMNNTDLLMHYVYVLEYCWNILDPQKPDDQETRTMTSILDLTGLDLSILRHRELLGFVKQFVQMTSLHYPQRSYKTLVLNAPTWFGMLYKLIRPLLRESTRAKVSILSQGQTQVDTLREILGDDCLQYLPSDLLETEKKNTSKHSTSSGDGKRYELPTSPMEQEMRDFCLARLLEAGIEMNTLIT